MAPEVAAGLEELPHIDGGPTAHAELEASEVRSLALRGVGALLVRSLGQRGLQMVGNVLLARWLAPKTLGLYAIVSFVVAMGGFLGDLGMGAALIQRKERLTDRDLRTAFTMSATLNATMTVALVLVAPWIVGAYGLAASNVDAVRVMALSLLVSSFSVVPSLLLERELRFNRVSLADLAGQAMWLVVSLPLAWQARSVWCFVWGTLASRVVHAFILTTAARWRPAFGFDRAVARSLLAFGLPYQATALVDVAKHNFIPTFIAASAGPEAVGYVVWALGLATNALFLMPIVTRVSFPAYARLQHDHAALKDSIEKSIKWVAATVIPTTLLLAALARQIVEHVYGWKWSPGLPSFYLLCIPMLNASYSTVMVSALYGLGKSRVVLRLTTTWAIAVWALGVPLTLWLGYNGLALALSLISWLSFMSVREMNKVVKIHFVPMLLRIFVFAGLPSAAVALVAPFVVHDVLSLGLLAIAGVAGYLALMSFAGELGEVRAVLRARLATALARSTHA